MESHMPNSSHADEQEVKPPSSPASSADEENDGRRKRPRYGKAADGAGPGRKPKACRECRKLKMKCDVPPGNLKCRHCLRRKVDCIFRPVGAVQSNGADYAIPSIERYEHKIDSMRHEIALMRQSLETLAAEKRQAQLAQEGRNPPAAAAPSSTPGSTASPAGLSARDDNTQMAMTRENSLEPAPNGEGNGAVTVEEPMNSLYEVTRLRNIRSNQTNTTRPQPESQAELDDFISRGVISEQEAEELYQTFHTSLNHYLWVGLEQTHPTFYSVRKSSELLTATILAVTALHIPTSAETFDKCYKEFLSLISSSMFSRYHNVDDVRGLCIAAFWLSEVSWKLSGHAIRIATELNIHQSFTRALEGDREHFLRARLWYMLYVCDHHFSIAYGRPPMIAESTQIREHELFLASPFAGPLDARILSQVALMQILTRVYERFAHRRLPDHHQVRYGSGAAAAHGADSSADMLSEEDFVDLRNFNLEIEQWRMRWYARQQNNRFIASFPPKGIILYSYFAKLQLNILAVRGVRLDSGKLSTERKEFTNMAVSAAASILTFVLEEEDLRRALVGTPLYVHTMIAFASVFLMKVATKWNRIMGFNIEYSYLNVSRLLEKMIELLKNSVTSGRHVLHHIAAGLEKMLAKMTAEAESEQQGRALHPTQPEQMGYQKATHYTPAPDAPYGTPMVPFPAQDWNSCTPQAQAQDFFGGGSTIMNDSLLYEAFGAESSSDVYSFLTSHFT